MNVIIAFTNLTLVTNKISVVVTILNFVVFNVYKLCKFQSVSLKDELHDGKDTLVVLFETKKKRIWLLVVGIFSNVFITATKVVVC